MDRLIFTALNSLTNLRDERTVSANNLANLNVPGFRRDLPNQGGAAFLVPQAGMTARAFQLETGTHAFSGLEGALDRTGDPMDIAIAGEGYFLVQAEGTEPALSRRGDLQVAADGRLTNGAGEAMLGADLQPIILPPHRSMTIDSLGQISIIPPQGGPAEAVALLATAIPAVPLAKSADGRIRTADDSPLPPPDQGASVLQGALEKSNSNATQELIESIELQRSFEVNLRMIQTAREVDEAGAALLRMPNG